MRNFLTLWRRELAANFLSPVAYVTMVAYLSMTGWTFMQAVERHVGTDEPLQIILYMSAFFWLPLLITVICMRLFAEEKRCGTIETLMTAPVSDTDVVLGKYAGALAFVVLVAGPVVGFLYLLDAFSPGIATLDTGGIIGGAMILLLVSAFSTAVGLLVSLLTRNQIVAAICCFSAIVLPFLLPYLTRGVPGTPQAIVQYVSVGDHILDFCRGSVDTRPVLLYVSGTMFLLFASVRVLESRRWK
jgi:ABC-2 type transport system permease protein